MDTNFIKLKNRVLITTIMMIFLLSSIFLYLAINEKKESLNKELLYKKNQVELVYMKYIEQLKLKYSNKLRIFLNSPKAIEAFAKRDRAKLLKITEPYFEELKKDEPNFEIICFGLPDSTAFLRAHRPDIYGDDISKVQGVDIVNKIKREIGGFMLTKIGLYYRINSPVYYKNKYIGLVSFGINIGAVNDYVSKNFLSDVAILIDTKKYEQNSWYDKIEECKIDKYTVITSTDDFIVENSNKLNLRSRISKIKINDKNYLVHKDNNVYDLNNNNIATILLFQDITKDERDFKEHLFLLIGIALLLLVTIIIVLIKSFNTMINKIISINTELNRVNNSLEEKVALRTKELAAQTKIAKEATKAKSGFLANMSHEIRTPLNAILGFVELLKEQEKDETKIKYLTTVDKSSQSLLEIINDILDFSKIESGKTDIESIDFNSFEEFETIAELFNAVCKEKEIIFNVSIDKQIPKFLNSDIQKLKQVILNLLSNAIKFTSKGKKVELKVEYKDKKLLISVKDEGIGIAEDKQRSIFEAFTQADSSTTRKYGGTGLGLSISVAFIKLLGGKLQLESKKNSGSEFYFSIPVKMGKEISRNDKMISSNTLSGKILVVEDNEANQMFMKVILKKIGLTFDIAIDGCDAIDKFKINKYDCILMDENMPNMGGIEATKNILVIEKELGLTHTPIIALTANALKGDRERFLEVGMDEYLSKPVDKNKLISVLGEFL